VSDELLHIRLRIEGSALLGSRPLRLLEARAAVPPSIVSETGFKILDVKVIPYEPALTWVLDLRHNRRASTSSFQFVQDASLGFFMVTCFES
jgi:hypothetical protein